MSAAIVPWHFWRWAYAAERWASASSLVLSCWHLRCGGPTERQLTQPQQWFSAAWALPGFPAGSEEPWCEGRSIGMCGQRQLSVCQCWLGLFPLHLGEQPEQLATAWTCFAFCPNVSGLNDNSVWLKLTSAPYPDIICIFQILDRLDSVRTF